MHTEALPRARSRYIPAAEYHAVVLRDNIRCIFVGEDGTHCAATVGLQMDHNKMFWEGGANAAANHGEMCGPHNRLLVERRLGRDFMQRKIEESRIS